MYIPQKQLDDSINGIVDFFNRITKTNLTKFQFLKIRQESLHNLDGIAFLFQGDRKITLQIAKAKLDILSKTYHQESIEHYRHDIECLEDLCSGECVEAYAEESSVDRNPLPGDACRHSVQSSGALGQSGTITCLTCNGVGIDKFDMFTCDDCSGTGRQVYEFLNHDKNCQCLSCLPYGPGLEPVFKSSHSEEAL